MGAGSVQTQVERRNPVREPEDVRIAPERPANMRWVPGEGSEVSFADKMLRCRDCGNEFPFTAGEQEFYAQKGLVNEPGRCPTCRSARKAQRETGSYGSGYDGGSSGSYGSYDRPRREMHPAVCAQCGQDTEVPFLPRGDRPVYCSACFDQVRVSR